MRSIRKFAYAAALAVTIFCVEPTLVAAEDARGVFTLTHEVHWQKYVLRPGNYAFSIRTNGPQPLLLVRGRNGTGAEAMLTVMDIESSTTTEVSKLVLVSRDGQSFVSAMDLLEYDMSLRFAVPSASPAK
jgi:hypothetical protein